MRMKNRFCRLSKALLSVACLLSTCGITYSCSDDFDLDETMPSFLGESIYDELNSRTDRKFSTVIRLIDDLDYKDVLSKTGSKTLFVADDDAYAEFFKTTDWKDANGNPVRSYDQLTTAQKRWLLYGSMLNNAYVLEMMTTVQGPTKNVCLRQISSLSATDTIPYFSWNELPENLNETDAASTELSDRKFWEPYRKQSIGGMYLALDGQAPLLTHFLQAQMKEEDITHGDVSFVLNLDGTANAWTDADTQNRSYMYNAQVLEQDVTCLNGYYHVLDKVLVTPQNMAEEIRRCSKTSLFSAMLDRYSAPYYDMTLTDEYKALHTISADTVYKKLYFASRGQKGALSTDADGEKLGYSFSLPYDPGWNQYTVNQSAKERDMAAMFVPSDQAMKNFFLDGGGKSLIERYGKKENTEANLLYNLYQIPMDVFEPLISNLMKESFNETVPSKYLTITNSVQDQMFAASDYPSIADYKAAFDTVMLANNGVVYVMNELISPPAYAAVTGPILWDKDAVIMKTVINADDPTEYTSSGTPVEQPLSKYYDTYLSAMQANFSLFVPSDSCLLNYGYVDPVSFASSQSTGRRFWTFAPNAKDAGGQTIPIDGKAYAYNILRPMTPGAITAARSDYNGSLTSGYGLTKKQMLTDMVDHHIIVHEDNEDEGIDNSRRFYNSRSGAPIYIKTFAKDNVGTGMVLDGGFQLYVNNDESADNDFDCHVTKGYDLSKGYGNGHTYFIDRPMQATVYNVFQVFNTQFAPTDSIFFTQCQSVSELAGFEWFEEACREADLSDDEWNTLKRKYLIFAENSSSTGGRLTAANSQLVRFFNNYRYTIFVPSDEAMQQAYANGLMSYEDIVEYVAPHIDSDGKFLSGSEDHDVENVKVKVKAMISTLVDFLKYHFCDESYFVDINNASNSAQSATSDASTGLYIKVNVAQSPNAMTVTDASGRTANVSSSLNNKLARDYEVDQALGEARYIKSSSFVVLHGIDNYLNFNSSSDRFDNAWSSASNARAFLKRFKVKK